jgi:hypothetical protein
LYGITWMMPLQNRTGVGRMKNTLSYNSLIKVALITVAVALMASQMTDACARGWSNYGLKECAKEWAEKYAKEHIKKYHACNNPDCRKCKRNNHRDGHNKACRKQCSEILPVLEAQNVVIDEIYNKLDPNGIVNGLEYPDVFVEKTGKVCSKILPVLEAHNVVLGEINKRIDQNETGDSLECPDAPVAKTGQTVIYEDSDDGDLQRGVAWPNPRFTDNQNGTVTDNLTGLIWLKDANRFRERTWNEALNDCKSLADDGLYLTDGSTAGDWHMANIKELLSLIDYSQEGPALPYGHPFENVASDIYWSSTTVDSWTGGAWFVDFYEGVVVSERKTERQDPRPSLWHVWCVRGGQ